MKKKIVIFGATGLLGSGVYSVLKDKYNLVLTVRDKKKIDLLEKKYGGIKNHRVIEFDATKPNFKKVGPVDFAVNGIGLVIVPSKENPDLAIQINGKFPHLLAKIYGPNLIHITTDCVFDGQTGYPYNENSPKNPVDIYGLSKSLGEPDSCLTLRTSIIGRELETYSSLLEWFLRNNEKTITGFVNHFWNGITTQEFGNICDKIFSARLKYPKSGIFHIFSSVVSKYDMLLAFQKKYQTNFIIKKDLTHKLNRSLSTIYPFCNGLNVPKFAKMLQTL